VGGGGASVSECRELCACGGWAEKGGRGNKKMGKNVCVGVRRGEEQNGVLKKGPLWWNAALVRKGNVKQNVWVGKGGVKRGEKTKKVGKRGLGGVKKGVLGARRAWNWEGVRIESVG